MGWFSGIKAVAKAAKKTKKPDLTVPATPKEKPRANVGKEQTKTTLSDVAPKSKPQVKRQERGIVDKLPPKRKGSDLEKERKINRDGPEQLKAKAQRTKNALAAEQTARRKAKDPSAARTKAQIKADEAKKKKK